VRRVEVKLLSNTDGYAPKVLAQFQLADDIEANPQDRDGLSCADVGNPHEVRLVEAEYGSVEPVTTDLEHFHGCSRKRQS
jgi:hypothetical protein